MYCFLVIGQLTKH